MITKAYEIFISYYPNEIDTRKTIRENFLNTINFACGLYIDRKVRKKTFEREFINSIEDLYDDDDFSNLLDFKKKQVSEYYQNSFKVDDPK